MSRYVIALVLAGLLPACAPRAAYVATLAPTTGAAARPLTAAVPTDSAAEQFIRPYRRRVVREMSEVLGTSAQVWLKPGKLGNQAPLTRWVTAVMLVEAGRALGKVPDFGAMTNGSVRSGLPAGPITVGNIFEIMPFENELTVLPVTGRGVRQLCDYAGRFTNVGAVNLTWEMDSVTKRARNIRVGGQPLDSARTYSFVTNDYLANGGDGMDFLRPLPQTPIRTTIRQAIITFLRREKTVLPVAN